MGEHRSECGCGLAAPFSVPIVFIRQTKLCGRRLGSLSFVFCTALIALSCPIIVAGDGGGGGGPCEDSPCVNGICIGDLANKYELLLLLMRLPQKDLFLPPPMWFITVCTVQWYYGIIL